MAEHARNLALKLIDKDRWEDILQRFIEVLRINIFLVDTSGKVILTPCKGRYGWKILEASPLGMELLSEKGKLLEKFKQHGFYLEYQYPFDLHNFAVPITTEDNTTIAYLIIGPVILNKRLESEQYEKISKSLGMNPDDIADIIGEIRTISFMGIRSILDLLDEVARYTIQLKSQKQNITKIQFKTDSMSAEISKEAVDILSSIYVDELLTTFLDMALKMTKTECGSILIVTNGSGELTIKISRGIKNEVVKKTRVKIGEGVAGIAAEDNVPIVIHGVKPSYNRVANLLKRPDIKHSLVIPLILQNKLFGVLSLHTKIEDDALGEDSIDAINMLTKLTSVAINSIQQNAALANPPSD